jgi:hypothetical protein
MDIFFVLNKMCNFGEKAADKCDKFVTFVSKILINKIFNYRKVVNMRHKFEFVKKMSESQFSVAFLSSKLILKIIVITFLLYGNY